MKVSAYYQKFQQLVREGLGESDVVLVIDDGGDIHQADGKVEIKRVPGVVEIRARS